MLKYSHLVLFVSLSSCSGGSADRVNGTPQAAVDSLLAADRGYAESGADTNVVGALSRMMAVDVVMPAPGGQFICGRDSVIAALAANPANLISRVRWTPIRGGISADGEHGFTLGFMDMIGADSIVIPMKYLAYWIRGQEGWRVHAFKRSRRPDGPVSTAMMPAALPPRLIAPGRDSISIRRLADELRARELAFSDEARRVGLGPAFASFGSADAMHFGGPNDTSFVLGAPAIAAAVGLGETGGATISWGAEQVLVASSGDLGVNIGFIVPDPDSTGGPPPRFPFFTVWRRDAVSAPWLYVAE